MIVTDFNILRQKNAKADLKEGLELIKLLEKELSSLPGVGLAAPQIGINKSVAIIRPHDGEGIDLVNPIIFDRRQGFINKEEACLSLPGISVDTLRHKEIFFKDDLHPAGLIVLGFSAVIVEHEIDHLEGILITDRAIGKKKIKRNDLCPCGSGAKYKKCHGR